MAGHGKQNRSFTLLEMLLVMSLVCILFCIGLPHFFSKEQYAVRYELEKLEAICAYLRERPMASGQPHELIFDPLQQTYMFSVGNKNICHRLADGVHFGFLKGSLGPPSDPKTPITQSITFKKSKKNLPCASFIPNGNISPGALYMIDSKETVMGALTCAVSRVSYIRRYWYPSQQRAQAAQTPSQKWIPLTS